MSTTEGSVAPVAANGDPMVAATEWQPAPVRRGPALIIIGIVLVVVIGGVLLAALGSTKAVPPATTGKADGLVAMNAAPLLAPITTPGDPPADVVGAVVVPVGSVRRSIVNNSYGTGTYDGSATFAVGASAKSVIAFYKAEMKKDGWGHVDEYAAAIGSGTQLLVTREGSDGYYWELGVKVTQSNGSLSAALAGASPTPTSTFVVRLEEVDDSD